jgi:hypothetical protein
MTWKVKQSSFMTSKKHQRDQNDGINTIGKLVIPRRGAIDGGAESKPSPAAARRGPLTPPDSHFVSIGNCTASLTTPDETFKYNDRDSVIAWIDAVSAAGTPEPVEQVIVWPVEETVRQPYTGNWHEWRTDWKTFPPDHSQFSSNDWAVDMDMFYLTGPVPP